MTQDKVAYVHRRLDRITALNKLVVLLWCLDVKDCIGELPLLGGRSQFIDRMEKYEQR